MVPARDHKKKAAPGKKKQSGGKSFLRKIFGISKKGSGKEEEEEVKER